MEFRIKNSNVLRKTIKSLNLIGEPKKDSALDLAGKFLIHRINKYVPMHSGALRESAKAELTQNAVTVSWGNGMPEGHDYTHYQYVGKIYKRNIPIMNHGLVIGWKSSNPKRRTNMSFRPYHTPITVTEGERGNKRKRYLVMGGYTTRDTGPKWITRFRKNRERYNETFKLIKGVLKDKFKEGMRRA